MIQERGNVSKRFHPRPADRGEAEFGRRGSDVCGSLAWLDGALTGTLNRLRDLRDSKYTELKFFIPPAGLGAERGNAAQTRGSFSH